MVLRYVIGGCEQIQGWRCATSVSLGAYSLTIPSSADGCKRRLVRRPPKLCSGRENTADDGSSLPSRFRMETVNSFFSRAAASVATVAVMMGSVGIAHAQTPSQASEASFAIKPHHTGISVPNLEESVAWYQRMLGFEVVHRVAAGANTSIALLRRGDCYIEVFQIAGAEPLPASRRGPSGGFAGSRDQALRVRSGRCPRRRGSTEDEGCRGCDGTRRERDRDLLFCAGQRWECVRADFEYKSAIAEVDASVSAGGRSVANLRVHGSNPCPVTDLGVPIVERGHRFLGFTPEGERVLKWARAILDNWSMLQQEFASLHTDGPVAGRLCVGTIPTALPMATLVTKAIQARYPRIEVTVLSLSSIDILRHLEDFAIDVGLTYLDNEPIEGMRSESVYMSGTPCSFARTTRWRSAPRLPGRKQPTRPCVS